MKLANAVVCVAICALFGAGRSLANARLHVTDELERYTERTLRVATDGTATIRLRPHAFAVVELP